jgi:hypothetical protein
MSTSLSPTSMLSGFTSGVPILSSFTGGATSGSSSSASSSAASSATPVSAGSGTSGVSTPANGVGSTTPSTGIGTGAGGNYPYNYLAGLFSAVAQVFGQNISGAGGIGYNEGNGLAYIGAPWIVNFFGTGPTTSGTSSNQVQTQS